MGLEKRQYVVKSSLPTALENIKIGAKAANWREAIKEAGKMLVASGAAEERYIDAMISMIEEYGPYCVIAPGLAIPHARPEDGALDDGLAVVVLSSPVRFGSQDNDPVDILIAFTCRSPDGHVEFLSELARFLSQGDILTEIRRAGTPQELQRLFGCSKRESPISRDTF